MKKAFTKLISAIIALALVLSFIPAQSIRAKAVTTNQQNIVDRANYFFDTTWVCQKTVYGWRDQYTYYEGETYHLPYGQPVNSGKFIGYGCTLEDFLIAAADGDSIYYSVQSEYNGWTSVYYATDCAAFVAMCWGTVRQDCSTLPYYSTKIATLTSDTVNLLQLGDALDSTSVGHVVLVTDLSYDASGNITEIEITEQTPPQLKRTLHTPETLVEKYGDAFIIYRYYGSVPEAPVRGYAAKCTAYTSHCTVEITEDAPIMSLPCASQVEEESTQSGTVLAGENYTTAALYMNTVGELWYQIITEDDSEAYIPAGNTRFVEQLTDDITVTDSQVPNGHIYGESYSLTGNVASRYNGLKTVSVYIYEGIGADGQPVTGYTANAGGKNYTLKNSTIDYNTIMGDVPLGNNTYSVTAEYKSYYATSGTTYEVITGSVDLLEDYFVVIRSSVNQNNCNHNYTTTVVTEGTCTAPGLEVQTCATCGSVVKKENTALGHSYGDWNITAATCNADGSQTRTCTTCGNVETEVIPATGHSYAAAAIPGTCQEHPHTRYTCENCGDSYIRYPDSICSEWSTEKPEGVDESLIQSKTQYRYSDLETVTSPEETLEGYTQTGTTWADSGVSGSIQYVKEWPVGFDTDHELYASYNNTPISASETEKTKTVIDSDNVTGYLYYHWCYDESYYSQAQSSSRYNLFHAYYDTTDPSNYRCDTSDMSYKTSHSTCSNSEWWFVAEVKTQKHTIYDKLYTFERWTDWSDWSDIAIEESDTRKLETQTVYRYVNAPLGDHNWVDGICSVCGEENITEPSVPETEPTDPSVPETEATDPSEPETEPTDPSEPETEPTDPSEPETEPTDPSEPQDPPVINLSYPTLSFEGEVFYNVYFTASNVPNVEEMGLLTWYEKPASLTAAIYENAETIIPGAVYNSSNDTYMARTQGIPAKQLGDNLYLRVYAKLTDGNYVYSGVTYYNAKYYANDILTNSQNVNMKALVVAMLNYGAAAQVHFNHNADNLMNASLTEEQNALVRNFSSDMISDLASVDSDKTANFTYNGGFSGGYPSVSFEGAFAINYYLTPKNTLDDTMTLYCWDLATYSSVSTLTEDNATAKITMKTAANPGEYIGSYAGIAAKQIDETVFVAGVYESNGVRYSSPVITYSLGSYCKDQIESGSATMKAFSEATVVYGDCAETYFAGICN